jgi:putative MATE family efflux protein
MANDVMTPNRLGVNPIGKLLLEFSIPAIIAMIANALYNVVDSIFVGRGVGPLALTAVTIAFPIMIMLMAFGMLVGIGATALVSIRLGQQKHDEAEKILGNAFATMIIMGVVISVPMLIFLDPILIFLGATPDVFDYAKQFTTIILIGSVFQFLSFGINNIIRAEGHPKISMATMLFSAGLNTILNPIFIFVFHWGIRGSAIATITTQIIVSGYIVYHFTKGNSNLKLRMQNLRIEKSVLFKIFAIGLSPFLLQMAASFTTFLFNNYLIVYGGEMAVAAMGVISRTAMMLLMPIFGINQGAQPIIGFNYGAKKYHRVKRTLLYASLAATLICIFGFAVIQIFSQQIISLFNGNQELVSIGVHGIRIFLLMLPIIGFQIVITNYFQAVGKASKAIMLSLTRQVIFLIPLIIILPLFFKLDGIWMAGPIADFLASGLAAIFLLRELSRLDEKHELKKLSEQL